MSGWARRSIAVSCLGALLLVMAYQRWEPSRHGDAWSNEPTPSLIDAEQATTLASAPPSTEAAPLTADAVPLDDYALLVALRESGLQYDWSAQEDVVSSTGACGTNQAVDAGTTTVMYLGQQACAEEIIVPALLDGDTEAIDAAILAIDWGFSRMADDGSFPGGSDSFHSTGLFLISTARTLLLIEASPLAADYAEVTQRWREPLLRAARYETRPGVLRAGRDSDAAFGHRRLLTAAALGLSAAATGDEALRDLARASVDEGVGLQRDDGVLAEIDTHDSHYQTYGVTFALLWLQYDMRAPQATAVIAYIERALEWEATRVLESGEVLDHGNSRTAGQETNRDGSEKSIVLTFVVRAMAGWALETGDEEMLAMAGRVFAFRQGLADASSAAEMAPASAWQGGAGHGGVVATTMGPEPIVGWSADLGRGATASYSLIVGDRVFATVGQGGDTNRSVRLVAFERRTGLVVWEQALGIGASADTDRAVLAFGDGLVLTVTSSGDVQTFDVLTGDPGWSKRTGIIVNGPPSSDQGLFVFTGEAVQTGSPSTYGRGPGVWAFRSTGTLAWQTSDPNFTGRRIAISDDRVVTLGRGGEVVALGIADGEVLWRETVPGGEDFGDSAEVSSNGSMVWVTGGAGHTYVLDGADGGYTYRVDAAIDIVPATSATMAWYVVAAAPTSWELQARDVASDRLVWSQALPAAPAGPPLVVDGMVYLLTVREGRSPVLCLFDAGTSAPRPCSPLPNGGPDSPGMAAALHTLVVPIGRTIVSLA